MVYAITLQTSDSGIDPGEKIGIIGFAASNDDSGSDAITIAASIYAEAETEFTAASNKTAIVFALSSSGNNDISEKVRITSDGYLGINNNLPLYALDVNGSGNFSGSVTATSLIKSGGTSSQFLKADGSVDGSTYAKSAGSAYHVAWFQGTGGGNDITYYGSDTKDNIYVSTDMYFQSKNGMRFLTDAPAFFGNGTERLHLDTSEAVFNDGGNNYDFRVEGDTDSDLLFVDANLDIVQIGKLNINGAFTFPTVDGSSGQSLVTDGAGNVSWSGVSGGGTDTNDYVDSISFNASDGVLTLGRTGALSDLTVDLDGRYLEAHPSTSPASSSDNSGRTYIQDILLDSYGHVTGIATATETVTDTTYTDGSGLSLVGTTFHANVDSTTQSVAPNSVSSTASRTYAVQVDSSDKLVVNVPWVDTDTNISLSGNLVGDLNLNNYDIVGTGNITIDGNVTAEYFYGDLDGVVVTECRNGTASTISEGTPVYVSGYYSANGKPLIAEANASSSSTMPAIGLLASDLASGAEGHVHVFGLAQNLPSGVTNGFSVGETVYVAAGGGLTNVRPTGVSELVQNMGRVLKTGTNGRILVLGPGRSNDVPNSGHFEQLTVDEASNFLSTIYAPNIGAGEDNSVVVLDSDGKLRTDEIDSRVWGSSLVDGNGTASYLPKWSDTDTLTNSIIYDDGTNVGIGTASPATKLHIESPTDVSYGNLFIHDTTSMAAGVGGSICFGGKYTTAGATARLGVIKAEKENSTDGNSLSSLVFMTNDQAGTFVEERMRITSDGKVGIGTATPQAKLDVNGTVQFDDLVRWEYPDKALDTSTSTLGYMRLYDEAGAYCGMGVSTSSFNVGTSGAINLRFVTDTIERIIVGSNGNTVVNELGHAVNFRVEGDADENLFLVKGAGGADKVGVGTATLNGKFNVYHSTTNNSFQYGMYNSANHYTTSNGTNYVFGNYTDIRKHVASGVTDTGYVLGHECNALLSDEGSLSSAFGLRTYAGINNQSDNGTLTAAYGIQSRVINFGQGTANINTARGIDVYIQGDLGNAGNGKITTAYGLYVNPLYNVTTISYGLYIAPMVNTTTNRYGVYQNGSNDTNVFMGNVGIGTNDPSSPLTVAASNEEGIRIHTDSAPSQNFIIGRNTSNGTLVFKGSQSDFSAYEFRSTIGGSSQTVLQTDRLTGAITFNDEFTFPTTDGSGNQAIITDGNGNLSWQSVLLDNDLNASMEAGDGITLVYDSGTSILAIGLNPTGVFDSLSINNEFTFPTTDGSADQVLVTNGSGVITWQNQSVGAASATAWGSYNGSTNARNQEYNVSSITDNGGAGQHTINLSITMSSTDYCVVANEYHQLNWTFGTSATIATRSTTSFQIWTGGINGTTNSAFDSPYVAYAVFGS